MSRAADGPHPHPLTPADLPAGDDWWHGCPQCHQPIQGGAAGLAAHRRTVHSNSGDPRRPITEAGAVAVVPHHRARKEMDVMTHLYEVDVPIRSTETPALRGVHVFTGLADSRSAAVRIAHEVYDAARAAAEAGREIPHGRPDGWGARGYRPGWELDWPAATVGPWRSPYSWLNSSPIEL